MFGLASVGRRDHTLPPHLKPVLNLSWSAQTYHANNVADDSTRQPTNRSIFRLPKVSMKLYSHSERGGEVSLHFIQIVNGFIDGVPE